MSELALAAPPGVEGLAGAYNADESAEMVVESPVEVSRALSSPASTRRDVERRRSSCPLLTEGRSSGEVMGILYFTSPLSGWEGRPAGDRPNASFTGSRRRLAAF